MPESLDVLVIGAGLSGLGFAKFFLQIYPKTSLVILDADSHIGGVWSSSRNFESFWTQTGTQLAGFSDPPLELPDGVPNQYDLFPAKYITEHLEQFSDHHVFEGRSLRDRIRLKRYVTTAEPIHDDQESLQQSRWRIYCRTVRGETEIYHVKKLAIATGHTSIPNYPCLHLREKFQGSIVHHKDFASFVNKHGRAYYSPDSSCQNVVILGSGKSAADMAYDAVKYGKKRHVSWILRESDSEGPPLFFPAKDPVYRSSITRGATRYSQLFSPSSFAPPYHPIVRLINNTPWGRSYTEAQRTKGRDACVAHPRYEDRPGALPGFEKLRPDSTHHPFWYTGVLGLTQHDDFWDIISQKVQIHRADVKELSQHSVILQNGIDIDADAILCGTGWKAEYPFLSQEVGNSLGLPHDTAQDNAVSRNLWTKLLHEADQKVISYFPTLKSPPPDLRPLAKSTEVTTSRLYNLIAPLSDIDPEKGRSIVFLGHCDVANSFRTAEAQGIWATAYFDGNLTLPSLSAAQEEVAWMNAFSRRRYPSKGFKGDCIFFETVWYTDRLMANLGLVSHKDGLSWRDYFMEPTYAKDFRDIPDEYRRKFHITDESIKVK